MDRRNREKVAFHFAENGIGALLGRSVRKLNHGDEIALVFIRQEAGWENPEETDAEGDHGAKDHQRQRRPFDDQSSDCGVAVSRPIEELVEERE